MAAVCLEAGLPGAAPGPLRGPRAGTFQPVGQRPRLRGRSSDRLFNRSSCGGGRHVVLASVSGGAAPPPLFQTSTKRNLLTQQAGLALPAGAVEGAATLDPKACACLRARFASTLPLPPPPRVGALNNH